MSLNEPVYDFDEINGLDVFDMFDAWDNGGGSNGSSGNPAGLLNLVQTSVVQNALPDDDVPVPSTRIHGVTPRDSFAMSTFRCDNLNNSPADMMTVPAEAANKSDSLIPGKTESDAARLGTKDNRNTGSHVDQFHGMFNSDEEESWNNNNSSSRRTNIPGEVVTNNSRASHPVGSISSAVERAADESLEQAAFKRSRSRSSPPTSLNNAAVSESGNSQVSSKTYSQYANTSQYEGGSSEDDNFYSINSLSARPMRTNHPSESRTEEYSVPTNSVLYKQSLADGSGDEYDGDTGDTATHNKKRGPPRQEVPWTLPTEALLHARDQAAQQNHRGDYMNVIDRDADTAQVKNSRCSGISKSVSSARTSDSQSSNSRVPSLNLTSASNIQANTLARQQYHERQLSLHQQQQQMQQLQQLVERQHVISPSNSDDKSLKRKSRQSIISDKVPVPSSEGSLLELTEVPAAPVSTHLATTAYSDTSSAASASASLPVTPDLSASEATDRSAMPPPSASPVPAPSGKGTGKKRGPYNTKGKRAAALKAELQKLEFSMPKSEMQTSVDGTGTASSVTHTSSQPVPVYSTSSKKAKLPPQLSERLMSYAPQILRTFNSGNLVELIAAVDRACSSSCLLRVRLVKSNAQTNICSGRMAADGGSPLASGPQNGSAQSEDYVPFADINVTRDQIVDFFRGISEAFPDAIFQTHCSKVHNGNPLVVATKYSFSGTMIKSVYEEKVEGQFHVVNEHVMPRLRSLRPQTQSVLATGTLLFTIGSDFKADYIDMNYISNCRIVNATQIG